MKIIVQAGGKGTRLEKLTTNKPKCLVSIDNRPMIFHVFELFPKAEFLIIGDYKYDVLQKYLAVFGKDYDYKLIRTASSGTSSGIQDCLKFLDEKEPFVVMWCDLILPNDFCLPNDLTRNYIGLADFRCRTSFVNGKCVDGFSNYCGIAGFFIFKNKKEIEGVKDGVSFVEGYLKERDIIFEPLKLHNAKEVGTLPDYYKTIKQSVCRPFNSIEFTNDGKVIKKAILKQGEELAKKEASWYRFISEETNFDSMPKVYGYEPVILEKVNGKNIFLYKDWDLNKKKLVLKQIVEMLKNLHSQATSKPSNDADCYDVYIKKTFDRINIVKNLIPFADKDTIIINGQKCKNIFFHQEEIIEKVKHYFPATFKVIHGDCTLSNLLFDETKNAPVLIDPRGFFGKTEIYGDEYYDWAKLYYSAFGNYDQFNRGNFALKINENDVDIAIDSNFFEELEDYFFGLLPEIDKKKIKILHTLIWFSLTTYVWNNYDSICGSFYIGTLRLSEWL